MRPLLLAAAALLLARPSSQIESAPSPPSARIGFVDLDEALRGHGRVKADLEELGKTLESKFGELRARAEEARKQGNDLAILSRESEEYYQKRRDLDAEAFKLEADKKHLERLQAEREEAIKLGAYEDIRRAAAEVALARGLDAVLRVDKTEPAQARSLEERSQRAGRRMVLSFRPELDITPEVIRLLNR